MSDLFGNHIFGFPRDGSNVVLHLSFVPTFPSSHIIEGLGLPEVTRGDFTFNFLVYLKHFLLPVFSTTLM